MHSSIHSLDAHSHQYNRITIKMNHRLMDNVCTVCQPSVCSQCIRVGGPIQLQFMHTAWPLQRTHGDIHINLHLINSAKSWNILTDRILSAQCSYRHRCRRHRRRLPTSSISWRGVVWKSTIVNSNWPKLLPFLSNKMFDYRKLLFAGWFFVFFPSISSTILRLDVCAHRWSKVKMAAIEARKKT